MRLLIDLLACQSGTPGHAAAALALTRQLAQSAGAHQLRVALSARHPDSIAGLRHALADCLAPEHVLVYDLPDAQDDGWLAEAGVSIHAAFLAAQRADVVLCDAPAVRAALAALPGAPAAALALDEAGTAWTAYEQLAARANAPAAPATPAAPGTAVAPVTALSSAAGVAPAAPDTAVAKPRLAYVSPLPPEKSGIADYSAELLPQLARYYEVDVIVAQPTVSDAWINANLALRDLAWFEAHAAQYQRVLYHFGNSPMHAHMFALLARHPGIVVLHDFYLANLIDYMDHHGQPGLALQALADSHGYSGLQGRARLGRNEAVWAYPCNGAVLTQADGVIVHSQLPRTLATHWYGPRMAADWHVLPLLRGAAGDDRGAARTAARARLGLAPQQVLVCAFGLLGPTKLNDALLSAWLASPLAADPQCQLVFVGDMIPGAYCRALAARISAHRGKPVRITGFVSADDYQTYLAACDIAVQLRTDSRGETSAAVLDCLMHGVATIANAHGATAELPPQALRLLPDRFEPAALADALAQLRADPALRARLGQAGAAHVRTGHAPEHVGRLYRDAIEQVAVRGARRQYRALLAALGAQPGTATPAALERCAAAIAVNLAPPAPRQLLVDVSAMVQHDLKTGIQRVVRSILMALIAEPPAGYRIEAVYSPGRDEPYRYARQYMHTLLELPLAPADDAPIDVQPGDLFLGLDLMMHGTQQNEARLARLRDLGVRVFFVVYDLLPVLQPDMFPFGAEADFAAWLATIARVSEGLLCISRAVAEELGDWLDAHPPRRADPLRLGYFHLGADIGASAPSTGLPDNAATVLAAVASRPTLLMVGTVEPRKGHAQALAACDLLWRDGVELNLVIVGKHGWMVDELAATLRGHAANGSRLFWLPGVSDEMLLKLYEGASALLAASVGEGFGLPLIEAAQHGLPIIARALPVFREVAGDHALYFDGLTADALAATLRDWLRMLQKNEVPPSTALPWLTWEASARQLTAAALTPDWRRLVLPQAQRPALDENDTCAPRHAA